MSNYYRLGANFKATVGTNNVTASGEITVMWSVATKPKDARWKETVNKESLQLDTNCSGTVLEPALLKLLCCDTKCPFDLAMSLYSIA